MFTKNAKLLNVIFVVILVPNSLALIGILWVDITKISNANIAKKFLKIWPI